MTRPAQAFAENRGGNVRPIGPVALDDSDVAPYSRVRSGELPPMMFQLRLCNGQSISFAYSDVREIRSRDSGHLQIALIAMTRTLITIEGRHLRELATLMGTAMVRWIEERDERAKERPEESPEIVAIRIESFEPS